MSCFVFLEMFFSHSSFKIRKYRPSKTKNLRQIQNLFEKRRETYVAKLVIQCYKLRDWLKVFLLDHWTILPWSDIIYHIIWYHITHSLIYGSSSRLYHTDIYPKCQTKLIISLKSNNYITIMIMKRIRWYSFWWWWWWLYMMMDIDG